MTDIAPWRLNLLRAAYLLIVVGLGLMIWPGILDLSRSWPLDRSVIIAMLGAMSLLSLLGLVHPLRMLPLLMWEIAWKIIWLARIALPAWLAGDLTGPLAESAVNCALIVIVLGVVPWDHVWRRYRAGRGERWRKAA